MKFNPVRIEDRATIERYTQACGICNCDLAFANMYCWEHMYHAAWCETEGFLLIRFYIDGSRRIGYMQPIGPGDFTRLIPRLEEDARRNGQPLRIAGLTPEGVAALRTAHPDFGIRHNPDYDDYVYDADDLRNLPGRRYQPKRNHLNRFRATYAYRYEALTPNLFDECMRLERKWKEIHAGHSAGLTAEQVAIQRGFAHFDELGLRGGALFAGEQLIAFTYGSALDERTFCIHIEKADTRYEGAFTMINKLFAEQLPTTFTLIDREEDLGLEGLRRSKRSYHPAFMQSKPTAERLDEPRLQIRALWRICFGDPDDTIDQFLLTRYDPRRFYAEWEANRLISMLHVIPFGRTAYIYAVATDPARRNRGIAGRLLSRAIDDCRKQGFRCAALIPGENTLKAWYGRFGFQDRDIPVVFRTAPGFDPGTGEPQHDRAMILPLDDTPFTDERLTLSDTVPNDA